MILTIDAMACGPWHAIFMMTDRNINSWVGFAENVTQTKLDCDKPVIVKIS